MVLGAPQSLTFVGLAIASTSVIAALQWISASDYAATMSAYGIVTRIMTCCILPLLGLAHAMQSITGHSFGAGDMARTRSSLRTAVVLAFGYCLCIQIGLSLNPREVGALFVDDVDVVAEVGRILPVILSLFFAAGPLMMAAMHFQAIGDAGRAALLGLSKPYLFAVPLTFGLAAALGEPGIWLATPAAEVLLIALTALVLLRHGIGTPITAARVEVVI
jgi:Na+-driven multidrug efflux pump